MYKRSILLLFVIAAVWLTGCAGGSKTQVPFPVGFQIAEFNRFNPTVSFADKDLTDSTAVERIRVAIVREVKKIQGQPFLEAAVTNAAPGTLSMDVVITRYERGSSGKRFAMAGLGQIHIDGMVTVRAGGSNEPTARYGVNKTFAWGGLYGATTGIEDVEQDFAKEVVRPIKELIEKKK